jgi:hypothetical protein
VSAPLELLRTVRWLSDRLAGDLDYVDYLDENAATIIKPALDREIGTLVPVKSHASTPSSGIVKLLICRLVGQLPYSRVAVP